MRAVAYSEKESDKPVLEFLIVKKKMGGYWCYNCEYFKEDSESPTAYRCQKYGIPDKAWGCCAGWEGKPLSPQQG